MSHHRWYLFKIVLLFFQCPMPEICSLVPLTESLLIAVIMVKIGESTCCQILVDLMVCNQLLFELSNFSIRILVDQLLPAVGNSYDTERLICGSRRKLDAPSTSEIV